MEGVLADLLHQRAPVEEAQTIEAGWKLKREHHGRIPMSRL